MPAEKTGAAANDSRISDRVSKPDSRIKLVIVGDTRLVKIPHSQHQRESLRHLDVLLGEQAACEHVGIEQRVATGNSVLDRTACPVAIQTGKREFAEEVALVQVMFLPVISLYPGPHRQFVACVIKQVRNVIRRSIDPYSVLSAAGRERILDDNG